MYLKRSLINLKAQLNQINWCIVVDFNAVRSPDERRGNSLSQGLNSEMSEFDGFLSAMEVMIFLW